MSFCWDNIADIRVKTIGETICCECFDYKYDQVASLCFDTEVAEDIIVELKTAIRKAKEK